MDILPGDMYCIPFPYEDNIFDSKPRPVVVLRNSGNGLFLVAPVTGTNWTGIKRGLWILKESNEGRLMELDKDSFIVVEKAREYPAFGFCDYWGHCPIVEELLKKLKN